MGNYDSWKSREPDAWPRERFDHDEILRCRDCRAEIFGGAVGTPAGTYCRPCAKWREDHGVLFHEQTKAVLERQHTPHTAA